MLQIPCGGARSSKVNKAEQSTLGICLYSQIWILTLLARSQNQVADFRHHVSPHLGIICKLTPNHLCLHSANKTLLAAQDRLLQVAKRSALFLQGLKSHQMGVTVPILKYVSGIFCDQWMPWLNFIWWCCSDLDDPEDPYWPSLVTKSFQNGI